METSNTSSESFSVLVKLSFEDPRCRELVISELIHVAYSHCEDFNGLDQGSVDVKERILDSAEPPKDRDLSDSSIEGEIRFYFESRKGAEGFVDLIREKSGVKPYPKIERHEFEDWNQKWRDAYQGVDVHPNWRIQPIWKQPTITESSREIIWMNPSLGFGTGEHPTTQLCLEFIGEEKSLMGLNVLDFGSGSGILAVGAAKRGAKVDAIEIDPLALDSARECASLNHVSKSIQFGVELEPSTKKYDLIVANILRNVLIEFSADLVGRLKSGGKIILSGILEPDSKDVEQAFREKLGARISIQSKRKGDWVALFIQT